MAYVRYVAAFDDRSFYLWKIVSFIEAEVLWVPWRRLRSMGDYAAQGSGCRFHIVHVSFRDQNGKRDASLVCE